MAGSYYNAPSGFSGGDGKAHHRSGRWLEAQMDFDIVAGQHFSSGSSKILRGEAGIIADDQTSLSSLLFLRYSATA